MAAQPQTNVVLELDRVDELFNAPDVNPFSSHEVEIFGEAGLDRLRKRLVAHWPSRPGLVRLTLKLPPDQITPDLAQRTASAIERYSVEKMEANRRMRRQAVQTSLHLLLMTLPVMLFTGLVLFLFTVPPLAALPAVVSGILCVLALFASSVAVFDSIYSLVYDWMPFVRDNSAYQRLRSVELAIEPQADVDSSP